MQICQYWCHDMSNSFLHAGMSVYFLPCPKYLNRDMNHSFLQHSIYGRIIWTANWSVFIAQGGGQALSCSLTPHFIFVPRSCWGYCNQFFCSFLDMTKKKLQKKQKTKKNKKAAAYLHSAFLPKRSQSLRWVIITGSIWSVGTCGQG